MGGTVWVGEQGGTRRGEADGEGLFSPTHKGRADERVQQTSRRVPHPEQGEVAAALGLVLGAHGLEGRLQVGQYLRGERKRRRDIPGGGRGAGGGGGGARVMGTCGGDALMQ
jgi:hypothetical protein